MPAWALNPLTRGAARGILGLDGREMSSQQHHGTDQTCAPPLCCGHVFPLEFGNVHGPQRRWRVNSPPPRTEPLHLACQQLEASLRKIPDPADGRDAS